MKSSNFLCVATAIAFLMLTCGANAATKGRIIPNGSVSFEKNGTVMEYDDPTAIDEDALIVCEGNCMVKMQGMSMIAADKSKFAVREVDGSIHLYIETGLINFMITDTTKHFSFYTPDGQYTNTAGFIAPAATNQAMKGYFKTDDKSAALGMEQGSMIVETRNGPLTINSGQAMQLALANVPGNSAGAGNSSSKKEAGWWFSSSDLQKIAPIGLVAGVGIGSYIIFDNSKGSSDTGSMNQ